MFDSQWRLVRYIPPYASLTAHAINSLDDDVKCCAHECAPCGALVHLYKTGRLSKTVKPYLVVSGFRVDWWDTDNDRVDWQWIADRICNPNTCENRHEQD